ncbi:MAG TPA: aconitate hydratase AcnA, partial [Alphaproteobacteria bacterium]|nr:aconitate hydratase AcnA [Alphaproteobacteria bacterium]
MVPGQDTMQVRSTLTAAGQSFEYFSLPKASEQLGDLSRLPFSLKVLLENLLRFEDGKTVTTDDIKALAKWLDNKGGASEIAYRPARVLLQDFTGVPAVVDLAAMREAVVELGADPKKINPISPVDLVIDHSVMVDHFGDPDSADKNTEIEFQRNKERYEFLRWGQSAFENFRVVPPGTGICHQVNLEYLAKTVWTAEVDGSTIAYPDTLVGTDSHTTMVNGLAVLGWGVGGIEAEAAMLGQPVSMRVPEVIGFKLDGKMVEGTTATDLVLVIVQMLREKGVVGKFVEFYGPGLSNLSLADRATIANMAPEYGATCGFFPIDAETCRYLAFTGREPATVALVEAYAKAQGMWRDESTPDPVFTDTLQLDMGTVVPSLAGPKRPQDRVLLSEATDEFSSHLAADLKGKPQDAGKGSAPVAGSDYSMDNGDVVIAAITSCTNTSNPSVLVAAGLVAKKANERGLTSKPWVKTSLAPGSQVVTDYLEKAGLQDHLDAIGFDLVGYGCTTCIGNSGPLKPEIESAITDGDVRVAAVLSGNRNFEGRVHPLSRFNYLASPPLVVAYALAGSMNIDITKDAIGQDQDGNDVFLADIWPSNAEVAETMDACLTAEMFTQRYGNVFDGTKDWQGI